MLRAKYWSVTSLQWYIINSFDKLVSWEPYFHESWPTFHQPIFNFLFFLSFQASNNWGVRFDRGSKKWIRDEQRVRPNLWPKKSCIGESRSIIFSGVGLDESRCLRLLTTTKNKSWNQLRHCDVIWEASKRRLKFSVWLNRSRFWIISEQKNRLIQNLTGKIKSKAIFSTSLWTSIPPVRPFLPPISALTGFHDWDLVTRWAQLLITSNYYLPSTPKDWSTMRAELRE